MLRLPLATPCRQVLFDAWEVYTTLLKIMVPALLVVKALELLGLIDVLGVLLAPMMAPLGLPAIMGVVWATTLATNLFTGAIVFFQVAGDVPLTVAQMTVLGTLMLIGHALPIEGAVARRAGVPWWLTLVLRVGGALVLGTLLHLSYTHFDLLQTPATFHWQPEPSNHTLGGWALSQGQALLMVFAAIFALMVLMKALRRLGIEQLMHRALAPLLQALGIGRSATNVTVIGVTLGLTYGAGLLIRDLDAGTMSRRDSYLALCFIGLSHSLIEDTLLVLALGADLSGILWARLLFSFVVVALLARITARADRRRPA